MSEQEPNLDEVRAVLKELPGPDAEAGAVARARQAELVKPAGALGGLEDLAVWLASWQGAQPPRMERPRIAIFAANHGVATKGVSAYPASVTESMVRTFVSGGGAVNQLGATLNADLRVYEMALDQPTQDFTQGPAMSEAECARALSYGMMAVEAGFDVMALGEMGIGNTTSAAAICLALFGGEAADWVDRGTGLDDEGLARKTAVVRDGLAANRAAQEDPFEVLRCLGGLELAAIAGAILACRLARTPVLLDGFACTAAAAVLHAADPANLDHCLVAHRAAEKGHARLIEVLGKEPLLDLRMRLGEASGAALAIPLLQAAVACHNGMATLEEADIALPE